MLNENVWNKISDRPISLIFQDSNHVFYISICIVLLSATSNWSCIRWTPPLLYHWLRILLHPVLGHFTHIRPSPLPLTNYGLLAGVSMSFRLYLPYTSVYMISGKGPNRFAALYHKPEEGNGDNYSIPDLHGID